MSFLNFYNQKVCSLWLFIQFDLLNHNNEKIFLLNFFLDVISSILKKITKDLKEKTFILVNSFKLFKYDYFFWKEQYDKYDRANKPLIQDHQNYFVIFSIYLNYLYLKVEKLMIYILISFQLNYLHPDLQLIKHYKV